MRRFLAFAALGVLASCSSSGTTARNNGTGGADLSGAGGGVGTLTTGAGGTTPIGTTGSSTGGNDGGTPCPG